MSMDAIINNECNILYTSNHSLGLSKTDDLSDVYQQQTKRLWQMIDARKLINIMDVTYIFNWMVFTWLRLIDTNIVKCH